MPRALQPPAPGLGSCPAQAGQGAKLPCPREHPASSWWHVVGCPAQLRTWHRLPGCGSCSGEALGTPTPSHGASTALMASRCCVPASSTSAPHHAVVPALPESHQDPPQPRGEAPSSASPAPAPGVLLWGQRCWGRAASAQRGHRRHLDPGPASPEPGARGGVKTTPRCGQGLGCSRGTAAGTEVLWWQLLCRVLSCGQTPAFLLKGWRGDTLPHGHGVCRGTGGGCALPPGWGGRAWDLQEPLARFCRRVRQPWPSLGLCMIRPLWRPEGALVPLPRCWGPVPPSSFSPGTSAAPPHLGFPPLPRSVPALLWFLACGAAWLRCWGLGGESTAQPSPPQSRTVQNKSA